jgi:hypothetical protein
MEVFGLLTAFGLSASSGLNAYIPLLVIALIARFTTLIQLKQPWDGLTSWWIIGLLVVLNIVEFVADKVPAVNHINDVIQTFIRPIAGAIAFAAAAGVFSDVHPVLAMACGLIIAGGVHAVKSGVVRPAVTATTGGTANIPVSIAEDVTSTIVSILSIVVPVFIAAVIVLITSWVVYKLWIRVKLSHQTPSGG